MMKYTLILLGAYFLYYAGNIIYDLFLKKEKNVQAEVTEEFSFSEFSQKDHPPPTYVEIEDVERVNTPKSYLKREVFPEQKQSSFEENPDLEEMRKRFEAEQDLDEPIPISEQSTPEKQAENSDEIKEIPNQNRSEIAENPKRKGMIQKRNLWKELLNLSETTVKMVANYEGQKVYHSTL